MEPVLNQIYQVFSEHPVISTDSRQIKPGSIFFALKGESFNGNAYAEKALEQGASCAIIDEPEYASNEKFFVVSDVLTTLQELARYHRKQFNIPVLGITGSNGKTTTKELIHNVLSTKFCTLATRGNLNNHIGVPLTLLGITPETEIAIIEMGANHPGEIDFLCRIAQPDYGIITNVGKAHLGGFGGFEGVIRTKTELSRFLSEHGGVMFLNNRDELLVNRINNVDLIRFGAPPGNVTLMNLISDPFVKLEVQFPDRSVVVIESKLYGRYNANNILAAVSIGQHFGISSDRIKMAIEDYQPANNRSQIMKTDRNMLILDAYNANPSSMEAALSTFAETDYHGKTVILGDMLELGEESDHEHQQILKFIDQLKFQQVYLVGPVFTRLNIKRENACFQDSDLARMWLEHHKIENSTILIKGSRGISLEKLTDIL